MRDEKYVEAIEVCSQRIRTMAIIHQKLYETQSYSVVNIRSFVMEIISALLNLYSDLENIDIKYEMDEVELDVDSVIKIGIILNELLTNSLKYAFPQNKRGEIFIGVKKQETSLNLKITDNGQGLPGNFSIDETPTVGMVIVKTFTEQMGGDIQIISPPGTTFLITLPINNHDKKS